MLSSEERKQRAISRYEHLKEHALANFETLLSYWGVEYSRVNPQEYDLIAKWRHDGNFGAVRFNIVKNWGSDFAGIQIAKLDFSRLGEGFDYTDCAGIVSDTNTNVGFDIIGLCQKIYGCSTYRDAAGRLQTDWQAISAQGKAILPDAEAVAKRKLLIEQKNKFKVKIAQDMWRMSKSIKFEGSLGAVYLTARGLPDSWTTENNIRFHPKLINKELNKTSPAILFKVSFAPMSELVAIHRIYLSDDGWSKAEMSDPKMALASIKGAGIWFGTPGQKLHVVEGPENALTLRAMGAQFVVCTINATNFHGLTIPEFVSNVVLCPDPDEAGITAAGKAHKEYEKMQNKKVGFFYPPKMELSGKTLDWNDVWQASK